MSSCGCQIARLVSYRYEPGKAQWNQRKGAKVQRRANCAKRLECVELAPAFEAPPPDDSASKLDALQTLRVAVHPQEPSQLASLLPCLFVCHTWALGNGRSPAKTSPW